MRKSVQREREREGERGRERLWENKPLHDRYPQQIQKADVDQDPS